MKQFRVFFTIHSLPKSEEEKLLKWSREGGDKPDIKYRKKKKVEVVESTSVTDASFNIHIREQVPLEDGKFDCYKRFATVFAVTEYREGQKLGALEGWVAEEQELIPKEEGV